jgi:hypothetical protein
MSRPTIIAPDVWKGITLHKDWLDGKMIGYSSETVFLVQVGKGPKGSYNQQWSFKGQLYRAMNYYNSINIGLGFKKRLVMCGHVLAKAVS